MNVRDGVSVRKVLVEVARRPAGSIAVAETVYRVPVRSAHRLRHTRPEAFILPSTVWPRTRARTAMIRPPDARTVIPAFGTTWVPPSRGVIETRAVLVATTVVERVEPADELVTGWATV